MNVLISSVSRKVLLVEAFKAAVAVVGGGGRVIAADIDPLAAGLYEADAARIVPRSDDPEFVPTLLGICRDDGVGLLVPTRDEELPVLAEHRARFAAQGTMVLVSPPEAIATCRDKGRFAEATAALGYATPRAWATPAEASLPAFVKPRFGKGGRGARPVHSAEALTDALADAGPDAIIQELIEAPEMTIDTFIDTDGRAISCVPRIRVVVVAGESVVSRTVRDPELIEAAVGLATGLGLIGHLTIQAFRLPDRIVFIELNPRYGGAANLGFAAGAPTPEYALRMARGERLVSRIGSFEADLVMLRHATDRILPASSLLPTTEA